MDIEKQLSDSLSGDSGSDNKNMLETLRELFSPSDFVVVKNGIGEKTGWVFANPKDEKVEQPSNEIKRVYYAKREMKLLEDGESVVLNGWEAYLALNRMWKQYAQKRAGEGLSAFLSSSIERKKFIDLCYGGIYNPNNETVSKSVLEELLPEKEVDEKLNEELGFEGDVAKEEEEKAEVKVKKKAKK